MGAFIHNVIRNCVRKNTFEIIHLNVWVCYNTRNTISNAVVFSKIIACV